MGILDDVKRLGFELTEDDKNEIEVIYDRAKANDKDEIVRKTRIEYYIGEYFTIVRPEIMSALEADKTAQNKELIKGPGADSSMKREKESATRSAVRQRKMSINANIVNGTSARSIITVKPVTPAMPVILKMAENP